MTYPTLPSLKQPGLVSALSLSGLAIVSLLGTAPSLAAAPAGPSESDPVLVANIFRQIGDAIRTVGEVVETVDTVDSLLQQMTGGSSSAPAPQTSTAPGSATPAASPTPATAQPARPAVAQASTDAQVLHRDTSPSMCETADGTCESFQLTRRDLPSGDAALIFSYFFNGTPVSFIAHAEPSGQQGSVKGYNALLYNNDDSSPSVTAFCEVGSMGSNPYGLVGCSIRNGPRFVYLMDQ
ncbi:MAG: hypothetical protein WBG32_06480 [Nodosilinea sp.]